MLRAFRFFGSQLGGTVSPIDERKGQDTLRKHYAFIRYFLHVPFPEKLTDEQYEEMWEGLVYVRNKLAQENTLAELQ